MKKSEACRIFTDIKSGKHTVADVVEAIIEVVDMPTHNSIRKDDMLNAIVFLLNMLNDVLPEPQAEEEADHEE